MKKCLIESGVVIASLLAVDANKGCDKVKQHDDTIDLGNPKSKIELETTSILWWKKPKLK